MRSYKLQNIKKKSFNQLCNYYPKRETIRIIEILLTHFLDISAVKLIAEQNTIVSDENTVKIDQAVKRLKKYEPIQHILGKTEFCGLTLKVNKYTLIPRPETEELVHWILEKNDVKKRQIMDIGTGSGCIAIMLAKKLSLSKIYAIDNSVKALSIASENAEMNQVEIEFSAANIFDVENWADFGKFDIIVSNPPYVCEAEKEKILPNVLKYEPASALFVDDKNALKFYRTITDFAKVKLHKMGMLYFEINEKKGKEIREMLEKEGFGNVELRKDINGKDRMICCQKP